MQEWVVIAIIAVAVIFGASKLPQFARNVGKAQGEFKKGLKEGAVDDEASPPPAAAPTPAPETPPQQQAPAPQPTPQPAPTETPRPADQPPTQA